MRVASLLFVLATGLAAQEKPPNLPVQKIGVNDLLGLSVYDAPELTRTVRVDADGAIRLPHLRNPVKAEGLFPPELERSIAKALKDDQIIVEPMVKVTIAEYYSRPISVMGAVKKPVTFQAMGQVTLLEALARAEGLSELAAMEILVTIPGQPLRRIPVRGLIDAADPELNLKLSGGEEVRVPEAAKIFVAGNVKKPGAFPVRDGGEPSVLKMVAMAEGLTPFALKQAYIYRKDADGPNKREITVELDKIMRRKTPDVPLLPNDVLYIPDNTRRRLSMTVVDRIVLFGSTAGATALVWRR